MNSEKNVYYEDENIKIKLEDFLTLRQAFSKGVNIDNQNNDDTILTWGTMMVACSVGVPANQIHLADANAFFNKIEEDGPFIDKLPAEINVLGCNVLLKRPDEINVLEA